MQDRLGALLQSFSHDLSYETRKRINKKVPAIKIFFVILTGKNMNANFAR